MQRSTIPRSFINELLQRIDIIDIIDEQLPLKRSGNSHVAVCPFHEEKTPSFHVSQQKQVYHCFGCGAGGNLISFLLEYERLTFVEAIEKLAARLGLSVPREGSSTSSTVNQVKSYHEHFDLLVKISEFYTKQLLLHPQAELARKYLQQRGLSQNIIAQFQLGYAPGGQQSLARVSRAPGTIEKLVDTGMIKKDKGSWQDLFYKRLMFPIHNVRGQIIGFAGRVVESHQMPKYINSPETSFFKKGQELYGLYQCLKGDRNPDKILIVEGYMDVIAMAQFGIPYAVATMGTATSKLHLQKISRYTKKIIFCFDGDSAGYQAAWRALLICLAHYQDGMLFRFMFLPAGEDPDTLIRQEGKEAFEQRITKSINLSDFFLQHLQRQSDLTTLDGKAAFIKLATSFLQTMPSCTLKSLLEERLSQLTQLSSTYLQSLHKENNSTSPKKSPKKAVKTPYLTLIQRAISLLIQTPTFIKWVPTTENPFVLPPGEEPEVLNKLIALLQKDPTLSPGLLIEHWRNMPQFANITAWANYQHLLPLDSLEAEFRDTMRQLQKEELKYKIEQLYAKVRLGDATIDEHHELQHLIGKSKQILNLGL